MKGFRVSILEKKEMLHALPWCLVIGMSLIVRLDPNLRSLSRLDSLSLFFGVLIPSRVVSIEEFGIGMCIFPEDFCNISLTFPLLMQLPARYWTWFNLVFLVRCIQLNHLEYTAPFTTRLVYADISRKICVGREIYVLLQGILNIFYINKDVCIRFVHTFQKKREYKIKGCALFSY
jgi:hypothetical protein